jgi:hypothetical protein
VGPERVGYRASGSDCLPHRALAGCGPPDATEKQFSLDFFTELVLIVFYSVFWQISNSFLYSNYSNEKFV